MLRSYGKVGLVSLQYFDARPQTKVSSKSSTLNNFVFPLQLFPWLSYGLFSFFDKIVLFIPRISTSMIQLMELVIPTLGDLVSTPFSQEDPK